MTRLFQRTIESFTCEQCGALVNGNGYTNHCPNCLWSKHVDNNPGDRLETCHGLMEPVQVTARGQSYRITHKCTRCGASRPVRSAKEDNFEEILAIAKKS